MTGTINFNAEDTKIKDLVFSNIKFKIPRYQRPYAWSEDQITDFWNDLISNKESYFIGSFILNNDQAKKTGHVEVIDGQQRLLTITIFMAVLRDILNKFDRSKADLIQFQDIAFVDRNGNESYRIECGDSTKEYFETFIQNRDTNIFNSDPQTQEEIRIKKNYEYFFDKVQNEINRFQENSVKISYISKLRGIVSDLIVIRILIENEEDAYEIFETTNARGIDLSVGDLLKNLIFKKLPPQGEKDLAKEIWTDMINNIQSTNTEVKKFLRYYWISRHSLVPEKRLFKDIKKTTTDYERLLYDLNDASDCYYMLFDGSEDEWRGRLKIKNNIKIYKALKAIRLMNVSQCYVLFLSVLRNYEKLGTDPSHIFQYIEKFTFMYSAICKRPGNRVEKIYSNIACKIEEIVKNENEKNNSKKIQQVFKELKKELKAIIPSYDAFKESFMELEYGQSEQSRQFIKYVLNGLNSVFEQTELDFENVNIEHLLPQNPDQEWGVTKKDIKNYVNKIGNLTLLHKKINSKIGNKIIEEKIEELSISKVDMTIKIVDQLKKVNFIWNEETILNRQLEFANLAYTKIWNL